MITSHDKTIKARALRAGFLSGLFSSAYLVILSLIIYATFFQNLTYFMAAGSAIALTVLYIPFAFFSYRKEWRTSFSDSKNIPPVPRTPPSPPESPLKHLGDMNRTGWADEEKHEKT